MGLLLQPTNIVFGKYPQLSVESPCQGNDAPVLMTRQLGSGENRGPKHEFQEKQLNFKRKHGLVEHENMPNTAECALSW